MTTFKEMLRKEIMEEMLDIMTECEEPVDEAMLDEFMNDGEFLDHVWEHGLDICCQCFNEGEELKDAVESIPNHIADCFDDMFDSLAMV